MPTLVMQGANNSNGFPDIKLRPGSASERPAEAVQKQEQFAKNKDFTLRNIKNLVPALKGLVTASKPKLVEFKRLGGKQSSDPAAKALNKDIQANMNASLRNVKKHFLGNATVKAYLLEAAPGQVRNIAKTIKSATFSALGKHIDTAINTLRPDVDLAPVTVQLEALAIGSGAAPASEEKGQESKVVTPPPSQRNIRRGNSGDSTGSNSSASSEGATRQPASSRQRTEEGQAAAEKPAPLTPEQQFIVKTINQIPRDTKHALSVESKYFMIFEQDPSNSEARSNLDKAYHFRFNQTHKSLQKLLAIPATTDKESRLAIESATEALRYEKGSAEFSVGATKHSHPDFDINHEGISAKIDKLIEQIETKFNFKLKPISVEETTVEE